MTSQCQLLHSSFFFTHNAKELFFVCDRVPWKSSSPTDLSTVKLFQKHFISFFEMERPLYCGLSFYLITDDIFHSFALVFVIQLLSFLFTALKQIVPDFISISFLSISSHYLSSSLSSLPFSLNLRSSVRRRSSGKHWQNRTSSQFA